MPDSSLRTGSIRFMISSKFVQFGIKQFSFYMLEMIYPTPAKDVRLYLLRYDWLWTMIFPNLADPSNTSSFKTCSPHIVASVNVSRTLGAGSPG